MAVTLNTIRAESLFYDHVAQLGSAPYLARVSGGREFKSHRGLRNGRVSAPVRKYAGVV